MRINKYIAHCGYTSRRKADELIEQGKVLFNGEPVTDFSTEVGEGDIVSIDGKEIRLESKKIYLMLNKPSGCISAVSDDRGRKTVIDIVRPHFKERLYPVGRLDFDTEGLLILTNDGDLADKLIHPHSNIEKTYYVELDRELRIPQIRNLEQGVDIGDYVTRPSKIKKISGKSCLITILEGKNRQVRRMFETQRLRVKYLKRLRIGELYLEDMKAGEFRELNQKEIRFLMNIN